MTIGEKIKMLRNERGLSQKGLGDLCDPTIHEVQIRKYERGEVTPKMQNTIRIANALGVSLSELLGDDLEAAEYETRTEHYSPFMKYVGSLGYRIFSDRDPKPFGKLTMYVPNDGVLVVAPNGDEIPFTSEQFKQFEKAICDSVEFQIWQQHNKK